LTKDRIANADGQFIRTRVPQPVATCRQSPYLHKPAIYHYDVIHIMTSFATELATPSITDVRYVRTNTIPRLIYKDSLGGNNVPSHVGTFAPPGEYN